MRTVIYLIADRYGITAMRKNLPDVRRGEVPIKLTVTVPEEAFAPPVLTQEIVVEDWRQGIDLADVEFRKNIITPEEAETIRQNRLAKMREVLEAQGYQVTAPETEEA